MKHLKTATCLAFVLTLCLNVSAALSPSSAEIGSNESIANPSRPKKEHIRIAQMKWYVGLTLADYEKWRGKKLNFFQKASFNLSQKRMKNMLKRYDYGEVGVLEKISWFGKGLLLGPIAVLLAYIFMSEEESELIKWTWFGFAGWAVLVVAILLLV